MLRSALVTQALLAGDVNSSLQNTLAGSVSFYLNTNTNNNTRFYCDSSGLLQIIQNNTTTNFTGVPALEVYPNGVWTAGRKSNNKVFCVYENGAAADDPIAGTNFFMVLDITLAF